jgi:hypothetical protein
MGSIPITLVTPMLTYINKTYLHNANYIISHIFKLSFYLLATVSIKFETYVFFLSLKNLVIFNNRRQNATGTQFKDYFFLKKKLLLIKIFKYKTTHLMSKFTNFNEYQNSFLIPIYDNRLFVSSVYLLSRYAHFKNSLKCFVTKSIKTEPYELKTNLFYLNLVRERKYITFKNTKSGTNLINSTKKLFVYSIFQNRFSKKSYKLFK